VTVGTRVLTPGLFSNTNTFYTHAVTLPGSLIDYRITEASDLRKTENSDFRILESDNSSAMLEATSSFTVNGDLVSRTRVNLISTSSLSALGNVIPFGGIPSNNVGGVWKTSIPYANHLGSWKTPLAISIKTNGSWKRVY
jgi:acyl CoA:acetate/3-ketoacid CoA transferase